MIYLFVPVSLIGSLSIMNLSNFNEVLRFETSFLILERVMKFAALVLITIFTPAVDPQLSLYTLLAVTVVLAAFISLLVTGCSSTRVIGDAAGGAAGALIGHSVSDGNLAATAAGAAGGILLSEGLHFAARKQSDRAFAEGYDKGRSDAVKQQYWLYVGLQKQRNRPESVRLLPVQLPEQQIDSFIELLTQQRSLFSAAQLTELAQLIEPLPDEIDVLAAAIATWLEN